MKGRYTAKKPEQRPAPGAYKYDFPDRNKAPAFGFGSSPQREPMGKKGIDPGPGNYHIPSKISRKNDYH